MGMGTWASVVDVNRSMRYARGDEICSIRSRRREPLTYRLERRRLRNILELSKTSFSRIAVMCCCACYALCWATITNSLDSVATTARNGAVLTFLETASKQDSLLDSGTSILQLITSVSDATSHSLFRVCKQKDLKPRRKPSEFARLRLQSSLVPACSKTQNISRGECSAGEKRKTRRTAPYALALTAVRASERGYV